MQLWHVRNRAIAFSIGHNLPDSLKPPLFIILPIIVLALLLVYYLKSPHFLPLQRWAVTGIIGGGLGNIIDRILRRDGVVDYVSVRFFGFAKSPIPLFRWERWPTFNAADASVVICCLILLATIIFIPDQERLTK